ncbi:Hsp20/alpha crystallin family protein [Dulcicalothrix desertica]|nr:Hsp20/alpha crystallin family protein [Dulcicalothrix desertica]
MAIISWQRQGDIQAMRRAMDSMFGDMMVRQPQMVAFKPAVELQDTDEALVLRAQIPGIDARDLDIRVTKQAVVISGEKSDNNQTEKIGYFRSEFTYGKFQRVIQLPVAVDNDKVQAEYKNGILSLTLPKASAARNQVVKVNLLGNAPATSAPAIQETEPTKATEAPATQELEPTTAIKEVQPIQEKSEVVATEVAQPTYMAEELQDVWAA